MHLLHEWNNLIKFLADPLDDFRRTLLLERTDGFVRG
jgi:hypothetical protein